MRRREYAVNLNVITCKLLDGILTIEYEKAMDAEYGNCSKELGNSYQWVINALITIQTISKELVKEIEEEYTEFQKEHPELTKIEIVED